MSKGNKKDPNEIAVQNAWNNIVPGRKYVTSDNKPLKILSPGIWNKEAGPDFLNAKISLENKLLKGSIEVHRKTSDWLRHGHGDDPAYKNVILHVVNKHDDKSNVLEIPVLELPFDESSPKGIKPGACAERISQMSSERINELLVSAGIERFKIKSNNMLLEMLKHGAEKTFIKFIFDAAGYKNNRDSFAELFSRYSEYDKKELNGETLEAVLWGESGLLPDSTCKELDTQMAGFVKKCWDAWWKIRKGSRQQIEWKRSGTRPLNSPERRIAATCAILLKTRNAPLEFILGRIKNMKSPEELHKTVIKDFTASHPLWDKYANFHTERASPASVIGKNRILELTVNALVPGIRAAAELKGDKQLAKFALDAWLCIPPTQGNKLIETATQKWFIQPQKAKKALNSAASTQGVIHLLREYCEKASYDCKSCIIYNST